MLFLISERRWFTSSITCNCRVNDISRQLEIVNLPSLLHFHTQERTDAVNPTLSERMRNLEFQVRLLLIFATSVWGRQLPIVSYNPSMWCLHWQPRSFLAHVCCGQTAGWIKMSLGTEVGIGPGDIVLDGDQVPPKGASHPHFSAHVYMAKRLDGSRYHLVRRCASAQATLC